MTAQAFQDDAFQNNAFQMASVDEPGAFCGLAFQNDAFQFEPCAAPPVSGHRWKKMPFGPFRPLGIFGIVV